MEFQIAEAIELIKTLAETENLTQSQALTAFVAEAGLDVDYASQLKAALFEEYTLQEMASDSLTKALYSVFVSGSEEELVEMDTKETQEGTKYKVRVQDRASGSSYVRYATREKIAELRANPNISSVEITAHGATGADDKGERTAAAKTGRDFDGDGKKESSSKEHAGVVHNAIQRAKGGKPDGQDTRKEEVEMEEGLSQMGGMARELGAKGGRDVLPWNKGAKYNTKGEPRKPGTNVHGEKIKSPTTPKSTSGMGVKEDYEKVEEGMHRDAKTGEVTDKAEIGKTYYPNMPKKKSSVALRKEKEATRKESAWDAYLAARSELQEMKHREADTGKVVDKAEIGKTYYTDGPRQKSSVALRKEKEAAAKKKVSEGLDMWNPDGDAGTHDKNVKMRGQEDSKKKKLSEPPMLAILKKNEKKTQKEEFVHEADIYDSGRENQSQRDKAKSGKKIDGKGVDNSTRVKLMPTMGEEVVTETEVSTSQARLAAPKGVNEELRAKIKEMASVSEECCPNCGTPECTCEDKKEEKPKKKKAKLDEAGMPIFEYSRNNARPGPSKEMIDPPADAEGPEGHMNPKGEPKRYKEAGEAPGDRRPNRKKDKSLPNEDGTVPNGAGV